jgi:hypothetical protein
MGAPRAPAWTLDEFDILLGGAALTDRQLAGQLAQRTPGAVGWVRAGVHDYHRQRDNAILSQRLQQHLANRHGTVTCPICKARF